MRQRCAHGSCDLPRLALRQAPVAFLAGAICLRPATVSPALLPNEASSTCPHQLSFVLGRMEATFLSPWEARPPCAGAVLVLKTCLAQTFSSQHTAQHQAAGHRCRTSPTKQCVLSHPSREPKDSGLLTKENRAGFPLLPSELLPAGLLGLWPLFHLPFQARALL